MSENNPEMKTLFKEMMSTCKAERKARTDLTVREVAAKLGKTENYISSVESGREMPSLKTFLEYLDLLGFDTEPLKNLKISDTSQYISEENQVKNKLVRKIYSLDDDQVEYLVEQSKVADAFRFKSKK